MSSKKNPKKIEKLFGLFIITFGLLGLYKLFESENINKKIGKELNQNTKQGEFNSAQSANRLSKIWRKDFKDMKKGNSFPTEFSDISNIKVYMLDKNLHFLLDGLKAPIRRNKVGRLNLEVSFISHFSEELKKDMLIIQYNFIDIESGNMIIETSRQITLPDDFLKS